MGLRDKVQRMIPRNFLKGHQESDGPRDKVRPSISEQPTQTLPMHDEVPLQTRLDEEKILEPPFKTRTVSSLKQVTRIGKSFSIKGDLACNEDLTVDGRITGKIEVKDHQLVIGPAGIVHADIRAKDVIVGGKLVGNISASGTVTVQSSGSMVGGVSAARIAIIEGAHFKGTVEIIFAKAQSAKG